MEGFLRREFSYTNKLFVAPFWYIPMILGRE